MSLILRPRFIFSLLAAALIVLLNAPLASARTFDFKSERFATFFGGTYGTSAVGDAGYSGALDGVSYDKKSSTNAGAQFGFLFSGEHVSFRIGVELVQPKTHSDITGADSSGAALFNLESKVLGIVPMATIEFNYKSSTTSRAYVGAGGGFATTTIDNTYKLTAAGKSKYPNIDDYTESGSARSTAFQLTTGYEILFTDTVTVLFELGYRYVTASPFKSTKDITTLTGKETSGGDLTNDDSSSRTVNLSGPFGGMVFRFYL